MGCLASLGVPQAGLAVELAGQGHRQQASGLLPGQDVVGYAANHHWLVRSCRADGWVESAAAHWV